MHVSALFWRPYVAKLCFRCFKTFWLRDPRGDGVIEIFGLSEGFKVVAERIGTWLCCVEGVYGVAILHVYALFWKINSPNCVLDALTRVGCGAAG